MPKLVYADRAGTKVPGVTTILGSSLGWKAPGLMWWAWKLGTEGKDLRSEREKAANAGSLSHACAEARINKRPDPEIPEEFREKVLDNMRGFDAWRAQSRIELLASEVPLVSEAYKYGGCLDAVGTRDGAAALVDFKSSKELYGDHVVQVAAYSRLWNENHPDLPIREWHILRWGEDGAFHHHSLSEAQIESGWRVFLAALTIYNERKAVMGRAA